MVGDSTSSDRVAGGERPSSPSLLEYVERWAKIAASIAIPIVIAYFGHRFTQAEHFEDLQRDYVKVGVGILQDPNIQNKNLRTWAVALVNKNAPVPISPDAQNDLEVGKSSFPEDIHLGTDPTAYGGVRVRNRGMCKFGTAAGTTLAERFFEIVGRPQFSVPQVGDVVKARTDTFLRSAFPTEDASGSMGLADIVGVIPEGAAARVLAVKVFNGNQYWLEVQFFPK